MTTTQQEVALSPGIEAVSDCLRIETEPFGIVVVVIEPGGIRTEWSGIAADHLRETSGEGACADQAGAVADAFSSEAIAKRSSPPEVITKAAIARRPKTRYAAGFGAEPLIFLRRWSPDRAYDAFIRRVSGIHRTRGAYLLIQFPNENEGVIAWR